MCLAMENQFFYKCPYLVQSQIPSLQMCFFSSKNGFAIYDRHWHGNIQGLEAKTRRAWPRRNTLFKNCSCIWIAEKFNTENYKNILNTSLESSCSWVDFWKTNQAFFKKTHRVDCKHSFTNWSMTLIWRIGLDDHNSPSVIWPSLLILQKVKSKHQLLGHTSKLLFIAPAFEINKQANLAILRTQFHIFLIPTTNLVNVIKVLALLNCLQNEVCGPRRRIPSSKLWLKPQLLLPCTVGSNPKTSPEAAAGWEGASHCK